MRCVFSPVGCVYSSVLARRVYSSSYAGCSLLLLFVYRSKFRAATLSGLLGLLEYSSSSSRAAAKKPSKNASRGVHYDNGVRLSHNP